MEMSAKGVEHDDVLGGDRISSLPDRVIQHILSFLETPMAAQTVLLSKRWRFLWAYTPALDFAPSDWNPASCWGDCSTTESKIRCAMLGHRSSNLRKLRVWILYYEAEDEYTRGYKRNGLISRGFLDELAASISTKVTKVEELLLNFEPWSGADPPYLRLPRGTLSSGDLRCLALGHCDVSDVDVGTLRLAGVTMLILHNVSGSSETLNGLISACCNVRDLYLTVWPASHDLGISLDLSLQEVRKLDLDCCPGLRNFAIDAPKLRHVELMGPPRGFNISMVKPLDLNRAVLDPGYWEHAEELIDIRNRVCEFGMARVVVLDMANCGHLPLDLFDNSTPCGNVKELVMDGNVSSALSILKLFPNLEDLTFADVRDEYEVDVELQDVSIHCLKHSLKRIKIDRFEGANIRASTLRLLIENAMVLETVDLVGCSEALIGLASNLMMSRASRRAQITCT